MDWHLLILTLPTENATARMRAWRALKASGAAVLRDGVYLLPRQDGCRVTLADVADVIRENGGTAYLLDADGEGCDGFPGLFDRSPEFGVLLEAIAKNRVHLTSETAPDMLKQTKKLRKAFEQLAAIDFFPGEAQKQAATALCELESSVSRYLSPDEPHSATGAIPRLDISDYRDRVWATRQRPWIDRLASAWLIRRFIDRDARFIWLATPADCPADALGFDFDGAAFTHVDAKVTFEALLTSFGLTKDAALNRLGGLVHYLDVGGIPVPEAAGLETLIRGMRQRLADDDELLTEAAMVFDSFYLAFSGNDA